MLHSWWNIIAKVCAPCPQNKDWASRNLQVSFNSTISNQTPALFRVWQISQTPGASLSREPTLEITYSLASAEGVQAFIHISYVRKIKRARAESHLLVLATTNKERKTVVFCCERPKLRRKDGSSGRVQCKNWATCIFVSMKNVSAFCVKTVAMWLQWLCRELHSNLALENALVKPCLVTHTWRGLVFASMQSMKEKMWQCYCSS